MQATAVRQIRYDKPQNAPLLRVAAYCRVSTDSTDQLHSYAAQIKEYTEYIDQQPTWTLADIYADEGLSGIKLDKRDDLLRMVADCKKGKIDRVLVKSISRFARNTYDSLLLTRMLKNFGVSIYFEEQDIDTGKMSDEFLLTMQSEAAQNESINISDNMRWSYRRRMEKGEFFGTVPAYGYRLAGKTMEIYEPEASVVRRIFDLYLSGAGKQMIANILNSEDIPLRFGYDKWYAQSAVHYILTNERYIGDALLQKKMTIGFPFKKVKNDGQMPQYYVENSHLPIISQKDFEAAQKLLEERRPTCRGEPGRIRHPLSGKLICPDCGRTFRRMLVNKIAYWQCAGHASGQTKCRSHRYREDAIHTAFILMVNKMIANREYILTPLIRQLTDVQKRHSSTYGKIYEIDRQIAEMNGQNLSIAKHHARGILDMTEFAARTAATTAEVNTLRAERRRLLAEDENDAILDELDGLDNLLAIIDPQTVFAPALFEQTVSSITAVTANELRFTLKGGIELTETIDRAERRKTP
ncbi:MAG: recombinase family protein [Bacteroidales bacterium]